MRSAPTHRKKIIALAACSVLLPVLVILVLMDRFQGVISSGARTELDWLAKMSVVRVAEDIYGLCEVSHDLIQRKIDHDLNMVRETIAKRGEIRVNRRFFTRWTVRNQFTGQEKTVLLPRLIVEKPRRGKKVVREDLKPLVDEVAHLAGGAFTVFQRINKQGDMLRVMTRVTSADGQSMIGSYIPAVNPDGLANPIVAGILTGNNHRNLEQINETWYLTIYEPLRDKRGEVIGMVCLGEKLEAVESLRKTIAAMAVGRGGEVAILGTKRKYQGRYLISRGGAKDGEDAWSWQDKQGRFYIQDMMRKALAAPRGKITCENFAVAKPGQDNPERFIAAAVYFPPYDWLIFASAPETDFLAPVTRAGDSFRWLLLIIAAVGLTFLIVAVTAAAALGQQVTKLVRFLTSVAKNIASGDLRKVRRDLATEIRNRPHKTKGKRRRDETELLLGALGLMTERVDSTLKRAQQNKPVVPTTAAMISPPRPEEPKAPEPVSPEPAVTPVEKEAAVLADEVSRRIGRARTQLDQSIDETQMSRQDLKEMENSVHGLSNMTADLSSRFTAITDQTNQIAKGVTVMNAIADRANLLALNASITAEKAGKFGKGFALVARDAGRLSNQTEVAARHINGVVQEIQTATSAGLADTDLMTTTVHKTAKGLNVVGDRLDRVVEHLQKHDEQLGRLHINLRTPSSEGKRIEETISHLSEVSAQTKESMSEFKLTMEKLNHAADSVQDELTDQGFSVVAREVRQMADQTVSAVRDIDEAIKTLQQSLEAGSVEREGGRADQAVLDHVAKLEKISEQLGMVIDHLRTYELKPRKASVNSEHRFSETQHVGDAMNRLSAASVQARESLKDFRKITERLKKAVRDFRG
ncbi:MAG: methyl-accepting chemotaxis protein [Syntrophaceae bacterium]|nr:methyl-accepting chemotaxis protein [Syntrophaceae bacterium]